MRFETAGGPHIPAPITVHQVMRDVLLALIPGVLAHLWFFGAGILIQLVLAMGAAVGFEALMLKLRGARMDLHLNDLTAPVTGALYALCLPPLMPWWAAIIGMFFAIVIAKHLYGGLGNNLFNPAMVGFVVIIVAFPNLSTTWVPAQSLAENPLNLIDTFKVIFLGTLPEGLTWDAVTGATPLDLVRTRISEGIMLTEIRTDEIFGNFGGKGFEWVAIGYLAGGLYLLIRKVISWHVPVAVLGTVAVLTLPAYWMDPYNNPFPLQHILTGGMVLGAFFIATDPVSGSTTPRGRLIFGMGVAILTLSIRRWGAYPDGVAFSVLLMNCAVPLIDRYTKPRVFGRE